MKGWALGMKGQLSSIPNPEPGVESFSREGWVWEEEYGSLGFYVEKFHLLIDVIDKHTNPPGLLSKKKPGVLWFSKSYVICSSRICSNAPDAFFGAKISQSFSLHWPPSNSHSPFSIVFYFYLPTVFSWLKRILAQNPRPWVKSFIAIGKCLFFRSPCCSFPIPGNDNPAMSSIWVKGHGIYKRKAKWRNLFAVLQVLFSFQNLHDTISVLQLSGQQTLEAADNIWVDSPTARWCSG